MNGSDRGSFHPSGKAYRFAVLGFASLMTFGSYFAYDSVMLCVTSYSAIFPFTALSTDFFHEKWGLPQAAGEGRGLLEGAFYNVAHMFSTAQGTRSSTACFCTCT